MYGTMRVVRRDPFVRAVALLAGLLLVGFALWAMLGPRSFFDHVATFPPFNRHLLHDIGVFQLGLGATLLFALVWSEALLAALAGNAIAAASHVVSHVVDDDLGGRGIDIPLLSAFAAVILLAALLRARPTR